MKILLLSKRFIFFGEQGPDDIKSQTFDKTDTVNDSNIDDPDTKENRTLSEKFTRENGAECKIKHSVGSVTYEYSFISNPDHTVRISKKNVSQGAENEPVTERTVTFKRLYENKIPGLREISAVLEQNVATVIPASEKSKSNAKTSAVLDKMTKNELITDADKLMVAYSSILEKATTAYEKMDAHKFTGAYGKKEDFVGGLLTLIENMKRDIPSNVNLEITSTVRGISISNKRDVPFVRPEDVRSFKLWTDQVWRKKFRDTAGFN
jgi:hypothetical protein